MILVTVECGIATGLLFKGTHVVIVKVRLALLALFVLLLSVSRRHRSVGVPDTVNVVDLFV